MRNRLLENEFIEKDGDFIRKFIGNYVKPCEDKSNHVFDIVKNVVVAEACVFRKNNQWLLNLYTINPIKNCFEKKYDSIDIDEVERYGDFFDLLLRSIYIDLNNKDLS